MKKFRIILIKKRTLFLGFSIMIILGLAAALLYQHFGRVPANIFMDPYNGVIIIDPGHGGIDGGASTGEIYEKDINLDISLKLKAYLENKGYTVILTRTEDISLDSLNASSSSRHQRDLQARVDIINNGNAQMYLSIHCNCNWNNPDAKGSIVFYTNKYVQNKTLSYCIQRSLNSMVVNGIKRKVHDPQTASFFILNHANIPGAIVETAFISNAEECRQLTTDQFKDELAEAIADGTDKYLEGTLTKKRVFANATN